MKSQSSEMVSIFVFCLFKQTSFYLNGIYKKVIGFFGRSSKWKICFVWQKWWTHWKNETLFFRQILKPREKYILFAFEEKTIMSSLELWLIFGKSFQGILWEQSRHVLEKISDKNLTNFYVNKFKVGILRV